MTCPPKLIFVWILYGALIWTTTSCENSTELSEQDYEAYKAYKALFDGLRTLVELAEDDNETAFRKLYCSFAQQHMPVMKRLKLRVYVKNNTWMTIQNYAQEHYNPFPEGWRSKFRLRPPLIWYCWERMEDLKYYCLSVNRVSHSNVDCLMQNLSFFVPFPSMQADQPPLAPIYEEWIRKLRAGKKVVTCEYHLAFLTSEEKVYRHLHNCHYDWEMDGEEQKTRTRQILKDPPHKHRPKLVKGVKLPWHMIQAPCDYYDRPWKEWYDI